MQHTPGPWQFKRIAVWAPEKPEDGIPAFEFCSNGGEEWLAKAKANAQFIVTACNHHHELVEALKAVCAGFLGDSTGYFHVEPNDMKKARSILTKVKEAK